MKFSQTHRIRTQDQFQHVFAAQQRLFGRFYVLFYRKNQLNHPRLGMIVRKRDVSRAVLRNRIKRKTRSVFRLQQEDLPSMDIVLVVKAGAEKAGQQELQQCLENLMLQLVA